MLAMYLLRLCSKFTMDKESMGELAFLVTLLKWNNRRSLYWYIGNPHMLKNTCTTAMTAKQVASKVFLPPF